MKQGKKIVEILLLDHRRTTATRVYTGTPRVGKGDNMDKSESRGARTPAIGHLRVWSF